MSTPAAKERVYQAIESLQSARNLVDDARQALSRISGACAEYRLLLRSYDALEEDMRQVLRLRHREGLRLDSEPEEKP